MGTGSRPAGDDRCVHGQTARTPVCWTRELGRLLWVFSTPALSFFYASAITLVFARGWRRSLRLLAPAGQLALTNYVLQWIAVMFLTYSFGLALYAKFGPAVGLLLGLSIFIVQAVLSHWYVRRFRFGPRRGRTFVFNQAKAPTS